MLQHLPAEAQHANMRGMKVEGRSDKGTWHVMSADLRSTRLTCWTSMGVQSWRKGWSSPASRKAQGRPQSNMRATGGQPPSLRLPSQQPAQRLHLHRAASMFACEVAAPALETSKNVHVSNDDRPHRRSPLPCGALTTFCRCSSRNLSNTCT